MLESHVFWLPKEGNTPEEYEDASCHNCSAGRFAIADGASDSYDSRRWAEMLVKSFADDAPPAAWEPEALDLWLRPLVQQWKAAIPWDALPWYKVEKARLGAFSTFLGIQLDLPDQTTILDTSRGGRWQAWAVGDACLFHVRDDDLVKPSPFPVTDAEEFGVTPALITTSNVYNQRSLKNLKIEEGDYRPGDIFLLATDALSQWFLRARENGQKPWSRLQGITQVEFANLISELRQEGVIRNDDVTLLVVQVATTEQSISQAAESFSETLPVPDAGQESVQTDFMQPETRLEAGMRPRTREPTWIEWLASPFIKYGLIGHLLFAAWLIVVVLLFCCAWLLSVSLLLGYLR
jgi:hypothetical protein